MLVRVWVVCSEGRTTRGGVFPDKHRSPKGVLVASLASSHSNPTEQKVVLGEIVQHHEASVGCLKWQC